MAPDSLPGGVPGRLVGRCRDARGGFGRPQGVNVHSLEVVLALVLGASLVTALAAKSSAPAPSLLVIAGLLVALIPGVPVPTLTPDLVLFVVLPPLLSAAAEEQNVRILKAQWRPITFLAVGLVIISATLTALVAAPLLHVSGPVAFVLGTILASTDPVAVTALARRLRLPERLESIIQAESLANDATSLVLFSLGIGLVTDGSGVRPGHLILELLRLAGGGALVGVVVSGIAALARRRTDDPTAQTVLALVTPYAAYVGAEALGAGGVTAVVVAGVLTGELVNRRLASAVRVQLRAVNGTVVFLLETVIFALIGLQIPDLVRAVDVGVSGWLVPAVILVFTLVLVRFLGVSPLVFLNRSRQPGAEGRPNALRTSLVATWAGTRGVVPLAAALSLPLTIASGAEFPARNLVLLVAASVVVLTLTVQGMTLAPLTLRTGVAEPSDRSEGPQQQAREIMQAAARARLDELSSAEVASPDVLDTLEGIVARRERSTGQFAEDLRTLRLDLLAHERGALDKLHYEGKLTDNAWRALSESLDLQVTALDR